jgi:hypothetical protein
MSLEVIALQTNFLLVLVVALLVVLVMQGRSRYNRATPASAVDEIVVQTHRGDTYKTIRDYKGIGYSPLKVVSTGEIVEVTLYKHVDRFERQGNWYQSPSSV